MTDRSLIHDALAGGDGVLRLEPAWVPRSFMIPGRRLRLHPDDLYAFGGHRGGINERWFSSTTNAANGPFTSEFEGLSFIRTENGKRLLLKDAVEIAGDALLGSEVMQREGGWNILCKFFDNMGPIPHHMHQSDEFASKVGFKGKPEAYYFPPQYNQIENNFPYTFMGLNLAQPRNTSAGAWRIGIRVTTGFWGYESVESDWRALVERPISISSISPAPMTRTRKSLSPPRMQAKWCFAKSRSGGMLPKPTRWLTRWNPRRSPTWSGTTIAACRQSC